MNRDGLLRWSALLTAGLLCALAGCSSGTPSPSPPATPQPTSTLIAAVTHPTATVTRSPPVTRTETVIARPTLPHTSTSTAVVASATPTWTATPVPSSTDTPAPPPQSPTPLSTATSTLSPSPAPHACRVLVDALNVRGGPGTEYPVVDQVRLGDVLLPAGRTAGADWLYVLVGGSAGGWVSAGYVECDAGAGGLPVMTSPPAARPTPPPTVTPVQSAFQYAPAGPTVPDPSHPCPG